jgi:predicted AlkP superfamily pyrophosphatase or phosphodiesterase
MLDRATLELARVAVRERELGTTRGRTDFLSVSLSQTDRVGHDYGPLSREQMDNLLRLDRELGSFLAFLDEQVGRERYVLGLSSDHGVMTMPEREGVRGLRLTLDDRALLERLLGEAVREGGGPGARTAGLLGSRVQGLPFVGPVYTREEVRSKEPGDSILALFRNSFVEGRGGGLLSRFGVEMWWGEKVLDWGYPRGTTHGSPYLHDRWVPLILVAPGVAAASVPDRVRPLDLAPTLAALAGIPFPGDLDGKPLVAGRAPHAREGRRP